MHYAFIMPRTSRPSTRGLCRAVDDFRAHLRAEAVSENAFAKRHGLVQSTVHRFVAGRTKSLTPAARKILTYAKIELQTGITEESPAAVDNPQLREALERAWDGRPETVELLASLIDAVGSAIRLHQRTK